MTVARRSVEGQELLYHSIKYTNDIYVLSELKIHQGSNNLTVSFCSVPSFNFNFQLSLKSRHTVAISNVNEMFTLILAS